MKATGIVRNMDQLGRIVIPKEIRRTLNINTNDQVEIYTEGDQIILKKYHPACVFCGKQENTFLFEDKLICTDCLAGINEAAAEGAPAEEE